MVEEVTVDETAFAGLWRSTEDPLSVSGFARATSPPLRGGEDEARAAH